MFEHYTEQARRALFFARYEAFQSGSSFIETEHVLLALFRDDDSQAARVLGRARVSLDEIRREIDAHTARRAPLPLSGDEVPFSDETGRVLQYASQEADRLLHDRVGTEHLLLGLLREEGGLAAVILREKGLRLAAVRDEIVQKASDSPGRTAGFPFGLALPVHEPRLLRVSPSRRDPREGPLVTSSPQRISADGYTLKGLIAWAYRADARYVELPGDLDDRERYDARLDLPASHSWPAIDRLVQGGIRRHFGIDVTRETKPVDVFVLTATGGPSPARRKARDDDGGGSATLYAGFSTVAFGAISDQSLPEASGWRLQSIGPISLTATTIEDFGHDLEEFTGHPVIDETGLAGTWDIELQGELQGLEELRQALVAQLALALTRARRNIPLLVVRRGTA